MSKNCILPFGTKTSQSILPFGTFCLYLRIKPTQNLLSFNNMETIIRKAL